MSPPEQLVDALRRAVSGRYEPVRLLGWGGMGVVYLARDVALDRLVAIKCLPPERAARPATRERFLREARTAARLSHPHIIPIHAVDEVDDLVYFVMAHVEGETLGQRVRQSGPQAPLEVARLLKEVAWALGYAHARGIVHRDIKPDNILLEATTGRALVSDFGIARLSGGPSDTTGPQVVRGTPEFISPEQASGGVVDARSDLYSLGVTGFYALSGRLPFTGPDPVAVLARQVADPPPPLRTVAPEVPLQLALAIDRCLAKDPAHRFQTGGELIDAISAVDRERWSPPLAVRAFLTRSRYLAGPAMLYAGSAGALAGAGMVASVLYTEDVRLRAAALAVGAVAVLLPFAVTLGRVRRLVASGHQREDLIAALQAEWDRRREELAFVYGSGPRPFERVLRALVGAGLGVAAATIALVTARPDAAAVPGSVVCFGASAAVVLLATVVARARHEQRTDPRAERRLRFWRGPLGRLLFRLAESRLPGDAGRGQAPAGALDVGVFSASPEITGP